MNLEVLPSGNWIQNETESEPNPRRVLDFYVVLWQGGIMI